MIPPVRIAYLFLLSCFYSIDTLSAHSDSAPAPSPELMSRRMTESGLLFTENRGQVADMQGNLRPDILFTAHSKGAKIFLTATGIHYQFTRTEYPEGYSHDPRGMKDFRLQDSLRNQMKTSTHRFTLSLAGANPAPKIRKEEQSEYFENFYHAHCPDGITGVHTFSRVVFEQVYPGIDWVIYSNGSGMKYDFIVYPGADPSLIRLQVSDAEQVYISEAGELVMQTSLGEVREKAPVSFAGGKQVDTRFVQHQEDIIGFAVNKQTTDTLVIDPVVVWATYYGGGDNEYGVSCAIDGVGNVYLAGTTLSTSDIAAGGFQNLYSGSDDAFLVKFNGTGSRLWATYYGGTDHYGLAGRDEGYSCATDAAGNVYLAGITYSTSGIAAGGFQNIHSGGNFLGTDAFLVKFSSTGTRLWATYYGGSDYESWASCATDTAGNVYLAGETSSTSGIASGGFQNVFSGYGDAFLVKFSATGSRLWATYYGGTGLIGTGGYSCATDAAGNVYLVGITGSTSGIASGGFQNVYGGGNNDAFLVKFSSTGARLWATYYGGSDDEHWPSCATDTAGNVYLAGETSSTSGIAAGGFQNVHGGGNNDAFLVKFSSTGARLWATYYGGAGNEGMRSWGDEISCATDAAGNVYLAGSTSSTSGIAAGGFQNVHRGDYDAFLVKFSTTGSRLWATYYGETYEDIGSACVTDAAGNIYLAGMTINSSGIASGGFQNVHGGAYDAFLVKISDCLPSDTTLTDTACDTYTLNTQTYDSTDTYTQLFTNAAGCDSIVTLHLTILSVDTAVSVRGDTLTALAGGATFQWLSCGGGGYSVIPGATDSTYVITANGSFAVAVTQNGCTDTSSCHTVASRIHIINKIPDNPKLPDLNLYEGAIDTAASPVKICADGSKATRLMFINRTGKPSSGIRFRVTGGTDKEEFGYFTGYSFTGDTVSALLQHPEYLKAAHKPFRPDEIAIVDSSLSAPEIIYTMPVHVYRAPVLMMHGLWGEARGFYPMWQGLYNSELYPWLLIDIGDYSACNGCKFITNFGETYTRITELLNHIRSKGFSSGRIDYIGHSMGGLLGRQYIQSAFYRGDIHKLITINTPHIGTQSADMLIKHPILQDFITTAKKYVDSGAVGDLKTNSMAIQALHQGGQSPNYNNISSHTIVTRESVFRSEWSWVSVLTGVGKLMPYGGTVNHLWSGTAKFLDSLYDGETHDMVVPVSSQQGGLSGQSTTFIDFQVHLGSQSNSQVISRVAELLNAPVSSSLFSHSGFHVPNYPLSSAFKKPAPGEQKPSGHGTVTLTAQGAGAQVVPGQQLQLHVSSTGTIQHLTLAAGTRGSDIFITDTMRSNAVFNYTVPAEAIGTLTFMAAGADSSGIIDHTTLSLPISITAGLDSIKCDPRVIIASVNGRAAVLVDGYFDDQVVRDISYSDYVNYALADTSVATYVSENIIRGKREDTTTLYVIHRDDTVRIPVVVIPEAPDPGTTSVADAAGGYNRGATDHSLEIYPNPNGGTFALRFAAPAGTRVITEVYNTLGRRVYLQEGVADAGHTRQTITLRNMPQGLYYVRIHTDEGIQTGTVIINE